MKPEIQNLFPAARVAAVWMFAAQIAMASITVNVTGPGGSASQVLPDEGGAFEVNLPLNRNAVNNLRVTATDSHGNTDSAELAITQVSLDDIVVSEVKTERLSVERVEELVQEGVIELDDPENYNVSEFKVILTVNERPVPISVNLAFPKEEPQPSAEENIKLPWGQDSGGGRSPSPPPPEIVFFAQEVSHRGGGIQVPPIPGVIIVEGRIRSLKEFFSVRLLLMNASGIFTLSNVVAEIELPEGALTSILPADGVASFGNILPGTSGDPGQVEKEFIVRGDEIGVHDVGLNFGGLVVGPGIASSNAIPFNGTATTDLEVKGPPAFEVTLTHPDSVTSGVPYEITVEIVNAGEITAMYSSLEMDMAGDAKLATCELDPVTGETVCDYVTEPVARSLGHVMPGESVREVFTALPLTSGDITSCMGISDQNISLRVGVGNLGCVVGRYPPLRGVPTGAPTVTVAPFANAQGISVHSPVVAFFSELMNKYSITTGSNGAFNVYNSGNELVPGSIRYETNLNYQSIAIWQVNDGVLNRFEPSREYTVVITDEIRSKEGEPLYNRWESTFKTTSMGLGDVDPPQLTLSVKPPVNPNYVLPGELVKLDAYASDQGSGVARVELRLRDLDGTNRFFHLVDQMSVFDGDEAPFIFTLDSSNMITGHTYQVRATAYDGMGNVRDATVALIMAPTADPPTIVLPPDPTSLWLQGVSVQLRPAALTGGVRRVQYFVDGGSNAFKTVTLSPYQAILSTLTLSLTNHTVRAVAVDGLGQTGYDEYSFRLVENLNMPTIDFGAGAVDGAQYVLGDRLTIAPLVDDPVGVRSVRVALGAPGGAVLSTNLDPFVVQTSNLGLGIHRVYVVAENNLGIANNPADTNSYFEFSVVEPPPGPPPPPPTITSLSYPVGGQVSFRGTSVANARIGVVNTGLGGLELSFSANAGGAFSGSIAADVSHALSFTAYDLANSPDPSSNTVVVVQPAPILTGIALSPANVTFSAAGAYRDLAVIGTYDTGGTRNLTADATIDSDNIPAASVDDNGRVVAVSRGHATISAAIDGFSATAAVFVDIVTLTNIVVAPSPLDFVSVGQAADLSVTGLYNIGPVPLPTGNTFVSGDPRVVTVNSSGRVIAVGDGITEVTVHHAGAQPVAVPVRVDTGMDPSPTIAILNPGEGATVGIGSVLPVSVRALDPTSGVTRIYLSVAGATEHATLRQVSPARQDTTQIFNVPLSYTSGTMVVSAWAEDTSGHTSAVARVTVRSIDDSPPAVRIMSPVPEMAFGGGETVTVAVAASDDSGIARIQYRTSGALRQSGELTFPGEPMATNATFSFLVPDNVPYPEVTIHAVAYDVAMNVATAAPVTIVMSDADFTPPETIVTAVSLPGVQSTATVRYEVMGGLDDLDHVEVFFRRDGYGTFNRYTDAPGGNALGRYTPQSGATGTVEFDSTTMGGDGLYEFYSVGVDTSGNRETWPTNALGEATADQTRVFAAGTQWVVITNDTVIAAGDGTYDNVNLRLNGARLTIDGHHELQNVELLNGAVLTHLETTVSNEPGIDVRMWTLTIDTNSQINVDARGYLGGNHEENDSPSGRTLGNAEGSTPRSGGSYGGLGGVYSGTPNAQYGSLVTPSELGSGGSWSEGYYKRAGGDGGGRIVVQAINVVNDGVVTANGGVGGGVNSGSGSGGCVYLSLATLSGSGTIGANGGGYEVGGGGGRVAIHYIDVSTLDSTLVGAVGGQGTTTDGGDGTVFLRGVEESGGTLIVDGQGVASSYSALPIPPGYVFDNIIIRNHARVVADDPLIVSNRIQILDNSIVTHSLSHEDGLTIQAGRLEIGATSSIDVSRKGYRGGNRDGNVDTWGLTLGGIVGALPRSAGSYGGLGGIAAGAGGSHAYGHPAAPVHLGSGGSWSEGYYKRAGGNGGGRVTIDVTSLVVDGAILADGGTGGGANAGSGSGGSVKISTSLLRGSGTIAADGGANEVGGGGGRVAVVYDFLGLPGDDLDGTRGISAFGGHGSSQWGSAGTVLLRRGGQAYGDLYIDDNMASGTSSAWTPLTHLGFGQITAMTNDTLVTDGRVAMIPGGLVGVEINPNVEQDATFEVVANTTTSLTVDVSGGTDLFAVAQTGSTYAAVYRFDNVFFRRGGFMVAGDKLIVTDTMRVEESGRLTHYDATTDFGSRLDLTVDTLVVASNGWINVDGRGYLGGYHLHGDSRGMTVGFTYGATQKSGGSYGGLGSASGGVPNPTYGSLTAPDALGSGGSWSEGYYKAPGGDGGGRMTIHAGSMHVDGTVSANGHNGAGHNAGSGSGGSLAIQVQSLTGSGAIRAGGGGTAIGGQSQGQVGGGGGRIAVVYDSLSFESSQFSVLGGQGSTSVGGNGTLHLRQTGQVYGDLVVDGLGASAPDDLSPIPGGYTFDNIILRNGANVTADAGLTVSNSLQVLTGSKLAHTLRHEAGLVIRAGRVEVDATSAIDVSERGYPGAKQTGNDNSYGLTLGGLVGAGQRAGGSYGGIGGVDSGSGSNPVYGHPREPIYLGSGGSWSDSTYRRPGGNGGGRVTIEAAIVVRVDGSIRANGGSGGSNAGDGSGGSVKITTDVLRGAGTIQADGGHRDIGGGGGRVAVYYGSLGTAGDDLSGLRGITAFGGHGEDRWGSAGTVLLMRDGQTYGDLYVDDGVTNARSSVWTPLTHLGFGTVAALTDDMLTVDGTVPMLPNGLVGVEVTPNIDQAETFTVLANTTTTLTVNVSGGLTLTDVASPGDTHAAVYRFDNVFFRRGGFMVAGDKLIVENAMRIGENGELTHYAATSTFDSRLDLTVGTLTVLSNGAVNVTGRGYPGGNTPGNAETYGLTLGRQAGARPRSAGSYGGLGGIYSGEGRNPAYGHPRNPAQLGSGGSWSEGYYKRAGGNGGGRLFIQADVVQLDGLLAANGTAGGGSKAGSGSGGGIKIMTSMLHGTGRIESNGGANEVGGGGGRIAVYYDTLGAPGDDLDSLRNVVALGGRGSDVSGSAGTVVMVRSGQDYGDLYVDDGVVGATTGRWTPLTHIGFGAAQAITNNTLVTDGRVEMLPGGLVGLTLNPNIAQNQGFAIVDNTATSITVLANGTTNLANVAAAGDTYAGVYRFDNVFFRRGGFLVLGDRLIVDGTMRVDEHGRLTHYDATASFESRLDLWIDTLIIATNGSIDVDMRGYPGGVSENNPESYGLTVDRAPGSTPRSGGSYGGLGGVYSGAPNPVYGDERLPAFLGSGGSWSEGYYKRHGGDGGGWASLNLGSLQVDGNITAIGGNGGGSHAGSGSGGTIFIRTGALSGVGRLRADGGANEVGGGGGRIAVYFSGPASTTNALDFSAAGGQGTTVWGDDGTVYFDDTGDAGYDPLAALGLSGRTHDSRVAVRPTIVDVRLFENGEYVIRWLNERARSVDTASYIVEMSFDLRSNLWQELSEPMTGNEWHGRVPVDAQRVFYRIRRKE